MNTTIDFKTAKTIENMSRKIDGMERAVSGFFNKMSDIGSASTVTRRFIWRQSARRGT